MLYSVILVPIGVLFLMVSIILTFVAKRQEKREVVEPTTVQSNAPMPNVTTPLDDQVPAPIKKRWTHKRWIIIGAVLIAGYFFVTNSYLYISTFSKPLGNAGEDGYYVVSYPTHKKIYFYRSPGGGELEFGKGTIEFVDGADVETFTALSPLYAKDKNRVYFTWGYFRDVRTLPDVNPNDFTAIDPYYGHDSDLLYYADYPLIDSNPSDYTFLDKQPTFKHYGGGRRFLYSNDRIFYGDTVITAAKRNATYVISKTLKTSIPCENATELRGGAFFRCTYPDNTSDTSISIDAKSFEIISHNPAAESSYAKDKNHVYYIDRGSCGTTPSGQLGCGGKVLRAVYVVEGADPKTFENTVVQQPARDGSYGTPGNFGYQDGCLLNITAVVKDGETKRVLVQHKTLPAPNVGYGGRCVYYTLGENPKY